MLLYIFIFVYLVGLSTIYTYFEEKKDEIKGSLSNSVDLEN